MATKHATSILKEFVFIESSLISLRLEMALFMVVGNRGGRAPAIRGLSGSQEIFGTIGDWQSQELANRPPPSRGCFPALGDPLVRDHKYQNNKVEMIGLSIGNEQIGQNKAIEGKKTYLIGAKSKKLNEMARMDAGLCLLAFSPVAWCFREAGESVSGDVAHGSDEASPLRPTHWTVPKRKWCFGFRIGDS